jgi:hypothetical protein
MADAILSEQAVMELMQLRRDFYAMRGLYNITDARQQQVQSDWYAKLDADLPAATAANFSTISAPQASCSIWQGNGSGGIADSTRNVIVKNRSDIAYVSGTHGIERYICGEWVFFGNCNPF